MNLVPVSDFAGKDFPLMMDHSLLWICFSKGHWCRVHPDG